jgi:hypothetical protein
MVKFQVVVTNIDETKLGSLLGVLPPGLHPEIVRLKEREERPPKEVVPKTKPKAKPKVKPKAKSKGKKGKSKKVASGPIDVSKLFGDMPNSFSAIDLRPVLSKHGLAPASYRYFLKKGVSAKLIRMTNNGRKVERVGA